MKELMTWKKAFVPIAMVAIALAFGSGFAMAAHGGMAGGTQVSQADAAPAEEPAEKPAAFTVVSLNPDQPAEATKPSHPFTVLNPEAAVDTPPPVSFRPYQRQRRRYRGNERFG
jgi:hypothetical protein